MQVIALLAGLARAADPLVATGPVDDAVRKAAAGAGRDTASFTPVPWSDLVSGPVSVVGAGTWTACSGGTSTPAQLGLAVEGAEGALGYGDLDKARAEVAEADRLAACLGTDAQPGLIARWHLVRGAIGEAASLGLARRFEPSIRWNPAWPPEGAAALDAATADAATPVVVHAWTQPVLVDGGAPPATLAPGVHLVRAGAVSGLLTVADEPLDVVLTPAFPADGPDDLGDPAVREPIAALLLARYGAGTRVFLADADEVWATAAGRSDWTTLSKVRRSPLIPIGLAVGAPAAVGTAVAVVLAQGARSDAEAASAEMTAATTTAAFEAAESRYDAAASRFRTAGWVAVGTGAVAALGAGLFTVGLAQGEIEVHASAGPGGGHLRVAFRR